jgi:O-glycosyl hydrolase
MTMPHTTILRINRAQQHQTIEGFGASGAWWSQAVGGWPEEKRRRMARLLYDREDGIGLTIYRYNIGGGEQGGPDPWRNSECFDKCSDAGSGYDWDRDANARRMLREVCAAGAENIVLFANSPPAHMTISGRASGHETGESNLRPDAQAAFARFLVDVARRLIEVEGAPVRWISPINEPQWDWQPSKGQEGCHYEAQEIADVLRALRHELAGSGLNIGISTPEAGEWQSAEHYAKAVFADPLLTQSLPHFAVHSYWSDAADKAKFAAWMRANHPGKSVWMSEWTEMQAGRDPGMTSALTLANTLHDDLTTGGATSWQYWIAVSKYDWRDGLLYVDEDRKEIVQTKRLWVLGNYSRFVRPGAVRVAAESSDPVLRVSAFIDPASSALTVVVINTSPDAQTLAFDGPGAQGVRVLETSASHDLQRVYTGAVGDRYAVDGESVTTYVFG